MVCRNYENNKKNTEVKVRPAYLKKPVHKTVCDENVVSKFGISMLRVYFKNIFFLFYHNHVD
jgi:hypothetical protein